MVLTSELYSSGGLIEEINTIFVFISITRALETFQQDCAWQVKKGNSTFIILNINIQFFCFREKTTKIVSKRVDDFRERTQPQLGKVHDPIKETLRVAPDHIFGVMVKPDEYGAGDLIHMRVPSKFLRGHDRERAVLAAVRHHLKKANYHNFHDLKAAFEYYDKVI